MMNNKNIRHNYTYYFIGFLIVTSTAHTYEQAQEFTRSQTYLLQKIGMSQTEQHELKNDINALGDASNYQLLIVAKNAVENLDIILNEKNARLSTAYKEDQEVIQFNIEIIQLQQDHLKEFIRITKYSISSKELALGYLNQFYEKVKKYLTKNATSTEQISKHLMHYIQLERVKCFTTYESTMHYFAFHDTYQVPAIINFWQYKPIQFHIAQTIKYLISTPIIQAAAALTVAKNIGSFLAEGWTVCVRNVATSATKASQAIGEKIANLGSKVAGAVDDLASNRSIGYQSQSGSRNILKQTGQTVQKMADETLSAFKAADDAATNVLQARGALDDLKTLYGKNAASIETQVDDFKKILLDAAEEFEKTTINQLDNKQVLEQLQKQVLTAHQEAITDVKDMILKARSSVMKSQATRSAKNAALETINQAKKELKSLFKQQKKALEDLIKELPEKDAAKKVLTDHLKNLEETVKSASGTKNIPIAQMNFYLQMGIDMMLQMSIMQGGMMAIEWIAEADAKEYALLQQKQAATGNSFQIKLNKIQAESDIKIQLLELSNTALLTQLTTDQQSMRDLFTQQQLQITRSLSNAAIATNYVSNPMVWDQYFLYAPMFTPTVPNDSKIVVTIPSYKNPAQVFYQGSWKKSPIVVTKKIADTVIWKFQNGQIIKDIQPPATTQTVPASTQLDDYAKLSPILATLPRQPIPHTWYNIARKGNWGYNALTNEFCQYQAYANSTTGLGNPQEANLNYIFTEYIPPCITDLQGTQLYQIQADITVGTTKPPWIAGIMFNGGRWISGVTDQMNQYRFCGFYATANDPINFYAGETFFIPNSASPQSKSLPITPAHQIMATPIDLENWKNIGTSKIKNPLYPTSATQNPALTIGQTYRITIITQPDKIIIKLEQKNEDKLTLIFGPVTIESRNPIIFNHHSIGFISSGCSSRFTLLHPEQLTYTQEHIDAFKKLLPATKSGINS